MRMLARYDPLVREFWRSLFVRYLRYMLIFIPLAVLAEFALHNPVLVFVLSALALIPLAGLLGEATEELAIHTGPRIGGLLNATLGNAAELIITIVALQAGKFELIKASLTGSIIGNLLLILGFALLMGGLRNGIQRFDQGLTGMAASMMFLAVIGLLIPTLFELLVEIQENRLNVSELGVRDPRLDAISLGVAAVLIVIYVLSLIYQLRTGSSTSHGGIGETEEIVEHQARWGVRLSLGVLAASTIAIVVMRELFLGVIIIPIVGNVAEHLVGVQAALKNQMDLSMTISLGSSMQIALFVAPLLVFISLLFGQELTLFFSLFEVMALLLSVVIATFISVDGESNWLEGAMLLAVYIILGLGFFYL
jgi:Ca2+:H+ antiporter